MKKQNNKPKKKFAVNDLESLQDEFYRAYEPDYWLYKIALLSNAHKDFDKAKPILTDDLTDVNVDDFKRMLRTEMHFLYFQMVETLFEIIFAISRHDNRNLWAALTFSNEKDTDFYSNAYAEIRSLALGKMQSFLFQNITTTIDGKLIKIPLVRWLFYFIYPSKMSDDEWLKNLESIRRTLTVFAQDFSERGEYNAYKHSLRFYNTSFSLAISSINMQQVKVAHTLGQSTDSIIYLEEHDRNNPNATTEGRRRIARTIKPFDFERDTRCCLIIHSLIKNMIYTRKFSLLKDFQNKEFQFSTYSDIKIPEMLLPKTGVTRSSFTV